jgi:Rieske Fe-S protein
VPEISRRAVLATGAATAGAVALGACSSAGTSSTSSATNSSTAGSPGGSSAGAKGARNSLGPLAAVHVGQARSVPLPDGTPGILARPTATTAACFSAICTHQGCTVQPNGAELDCPCHGSRFAALTGAVLNGPATAPLRRIAVRVVGGDVLIG